VLLEQLYHILLFFGGDLKHLHQVLPQQKTGLNFSLYKSTESTLLPFASAVLTNVSLIAALKDLSL
jgi:hypothetical protein